LQNFAEVKQMTKAKTCRQPDCQTTLSRYNWSGVCRQHNHLRGYCGCDTCASDLLEHTQQPMPDRSGIAEAKKAKLKAAVKSAEYNSPPPAPRLKAWPATWGEQPW